MENYMKEVTTKSGFHCFVDSRKLNNMELVDALSTLEKGGVTGTLAFSDVCRLLLGDDLRQQLYNYLRTEDGCVPADKVEAELYDIMQALGDNAKK